MTKTQVFERALTSNDQKKVYLQLAGIYERSNNVELADQLYKTMTKKFKESSQIWIKYFVYKFKQNAADAARDVLQRALQSLPKRKSKIWSLYIKFY